MPVLAATGFQLVAGASFGVGPLPGTSRWFDVQEATNSAGLVIAVQSLESLGLVVLPRMVWVALTQREDPRRARFLLLATGVAGVVVGVAACLFFTATAIDEGFGFTTTTLYAEIAAGVLLSAGTVVFALRARVDWPVPPWPEEDEADQVGRMSLLSDCQNLEPAPVSDRARSLGPVARSGARSACVHRRQIRR